MMQHNNTANTHRSLCALAIVFTSTKWGGVFANKGMFANYVEYGIYNNFYAGATVVASVC